MAHPGLRGERSSQTEAVHCLLAGLDDHNCRATGHPGPHQMQRLLSRTVAMSRAHSILPRTGHPGT